MILISLFRTAVFSIALILFAVVARSQTTLNTSFVKQIFDDPVRSLTVHDNIMYLASFEWIVTADISDPLNPVFLDTLDWTETPQERSDPQLEGLDVHYPYLFGATLQGILVFDISNPMDIQRAALFPLDNNGNVFRVTQYGNGLLLVRDNTTYILDASNPLQLSVLHQYPYPIWSYFSEPKGVFIDTLIFLNNGLFSVNASGELALIKTYYPPESMIVSLAISGQYIFFGTGIATQSLFIYSFDNLFNFTYEGQIAPQLVNSDITLLQIQRDYAYAAGDITFVSIFDISNPKQPTEAGYFHMSRWGALHGMYVIDQYIYIATANNGVVLVETHLPETNSSPTPIPSAFSLSPAYPNPFSYSTTITYSLPTQQHISLDVYNILGRKVQSLYNGLREPGTHTARLDASALPAGMYRVVLRSAEGMKTQLVVVR